MQYAPLKSLLAGLVLQLAFLVAAAAPPAPGVQYKIVTASQRGTYIQIGRDLARWVAAPAGIDLEVLPSNGSMENVRRLRDEPGVKLALVQSDVYQAYLDEAASGRQEAGRLIRPLRLVMPLYDEEINFVVRADSPLKYIHEIRGRRIGIGAESSGTALTATTIYRAMFQEDIAPTNRQFFATNEDELVALDRKSIDVAVIVAGQPAKIFADMPPAARGLIRLLQRDPNAPETARALPTYSQATIRTSSYPWLAADVPTFAVQAYLVTYDYSLPDTARHLARFADELCANFDKLQAEGHPKWKQVRLELPALRQGWRYYPPVEQHLRACVKGRPAPVRLPRRDDCTEQAMLLRLCEKS